MMVVVVVEVTVNLRHDVMVLRQTRACGPHIPAKRGLSKFSTFNPHREKLASTSTVS